MPRRLLDGRAPLVANVTALASVFAVLCSGCGASPGGGDNTGAGGGAGPGNGAGGSSVTGAGGTTTSAGGATGAGGATSTGAGGSATDGGSGTGLLKDGKCFPVCGFPAVTNPAGDGYGWEQQRTCLVATSAAAAGTTACNPAPLPNLPAPGNGVFDGTSCLSYCSSALTDTNHTGYGFEHGRNCIVAGTAAAYGGVSCAPPPLPAGSGVVITSGTTMMCAPICTNPAVSDPDGDGFGFENNLTCVVSTSLTALQGTPCVPPTPPPPPPPPTPPPGTNWNATYTATMFGQADCAPLGVTDSTNLNGSTCVARGAVHLSGANTMYYGAAGDLSTLWNGAPACTCIGGQSASGVCSSPPACAGQSDCGQCVEVTCNAAGTYSFNGDGFTHDEFCKPGQSVVVQLIDACPHNHPSNTYWCTAARPQHIDLSCTAFNALVNATTARPLSSIGSINVYTRMVDCAVGLGVHTF